MKNERKNWLSYAGRKIKVTKADIKNGKPGDANYCPIALALRRELQLGDHVNAVSVCGEEISIGKTDYLLSPKADRFVEKFDDEEPVRPITVTIKKVVED